MVFILAAIHLYKNILPYYFSPQATLIPENLIGYNTKAAERGEFHGQEVYSYFIPEPVKLASVLGTNDGGNKRIEVDLTNQRVYAFEGDRKVYDFLVSTGKWAPTPTGTFRIWIKLRATKMEGGSKILNTYYYLPNVPYTMFFANSEVPAYRGFSLHGTYWHSNFGHPMSHGCVNLKTEDAEKLYYWATPNLNSKPSIQASDDNPGTPVIIYGRAPQEV